MLILTILLLTPFPIRFIYFEKIEHSVINDNNQFCNREIIQCGDVRAYRCVGQRTIRGDQTS